MCVSNIDIYVYIHESVVSHNKSMYGPIKWCGAHIHIIYGGKNVGAGPSERWFNQSSAFLFYGLFIYCLGVCPGATDASHNALRPTKMREREKGEKQYSIVA